MTSLPSYLAYPLKRSPCISISSRFPISSSSLTFHYWLLFLNIFLHVSRHTLSVALFQLVCFFHIIFFLFSSYSFYCVISLSMFLLHHYFFFLFILRHEYGSSVHQFIFPVSILISVSLTLLVFLMFLLPYLHVTHGPYAIAPLLKVHRCISLVSMLICFIDSASFLHGSLTVV